MTVWTLPPVIGFALAFALVALILARGWHWAIDRPNERSLHVRPTPRTGGVALMAGLCAAAGTAAALGPGVPLVAVALALALSAMSLIDDRRGLPIAVRLGAHLLAAIVFTATLPGFAPSMPWFWLPLAVLAITAMTNFFNFMDGANGIAGGMAVAGFGSYGIAAAIEGAPGLAALCFSVAAAAAGFLCFNLRGRIFMGDSGSVPLGFLAAALGFAGWAQGLWPGWFGPLAFAPFVADASLTLGRRIGRGDRFWQAHHEHYYQRLVRSGWSHGRLALAEYAVMATCAGAALFSRRADGTTQAVVFATIAGLLGTIGFLVDRRWRNFQAGSLPGRT